MKIDIPKVVRPLVLSDYAEGFGVDPKTGEDVPMWVWVNPPLAVLREHDGTHAEINQGITRF